MIHLQVRERRACGAPEGDMLDYKRFDEVDCPACRASLYGTSAQRMLDAESHFTVKQIAALARKTAPKPRITGPLGDPSKVDPNAPPGTRLRQRHATMSEDEKLEGFRRVSAMAEDTCPGCWGSIIGQEHTPECRGPDPEQWVLTDEEVQAELELYGIDIEASRTRFSKLLNNLTAKVVR